MTTRCKPCGKRIYANCKEAKADVCIIMQRNRHLAKAGWLRAYRCPEGFWHIGHAAPHKRGR